MSENLPTPADAARSRLRRIVPTLLLILISVMIVRDILVRRWGSPPPPASDVTQRSR
jgi:peptidoglycan/LPS O-acetylase OafA/YrhL